MFTKKYVFPILFCLTLSGIGQAQDLVYRPVNPAFGGETFNYQWLLSSASAQDLTEDTRGDIFNRSATNSVDAFAASLERQVLNSLSRELISAQFGEGTALTDGTYEFGNFQLDVTTTLEGLSITIFDLVQGEQTQIVIPFF